MFGPWVRPMNTCTCFVFERTLVSMSPDIPSSSNHKFSRREEESVLEERKKKQRETTEIICQEIGEDKKKVEGKI